MSHYKPYPAYKDSGVEWLGEVPEHWELARFDAKSTTHRDSIDADRLTGLRVLHYSIPAVQEFGHGQEEDGSEIDSNKLIINQKQLLVSKLNPHKQTLVVADKSESFLTVASTEFVPLIPVAADLAYITYVWSSAYCQHYLLARCESSTRSHQRVAPPDITRMPWAWPALDEQKAVVSVLDRETARIDALTEKKTRFIELLREKRQALITHAVTKGLDPSVKMKDSGVEWLGEVPEHWDVLSFQRCVFIAEGQVDPEKSPYREMVLLAPNHIESGSGLLLYTETAEEQNAESGKYLCQKGDVVYSKIRPALRKACIAPDLSLCSADMYPMRGHSGMSNQFLFWFLLSEPFSAFAVLEADRVAMPKINRESLNSVQLPRPPINEQMEIVAWVAQSTARLDNLRAKTERSIELLKERRSALITAAVTGQIDLREAV